MTKSGINLLLALFATLATVARSISETALEGAGAAGSMSSKKRWPSQTIAYVLSPSFTAAEKDNIVKGMAAFNESTCLRFVPRQEQDDTLFVDIVKDQGCYTYPVRTGHLVSLVSGCLFPGGVLHQLMYALGFQKEHNRSDRDNFVKINWKNIMTGFENQFRKHEAEEGDLKAPYDVCSIMHLSKNGFAKSVNGKKQDSFTVINPDVSCKVGQRDGLSALDIKKLNTFYECKNYPQLAYSSENIWTCKNDPKVDFCTGVDCKQAWDNYCKAWALKGHCTEPVFKGFMADKCCDACTAQTGCFDQRGESFCLELAGKGKCSRDEKTRETECCKTCNACIDYKKGCNYWAKKEDRCTKNPGYMKMLCKKSCGVCQ